MASLLSRARRTVMIIAVAAPTALIPLQVSSHAATVPAHPFSDPVWYPLRASMEMGCANGNPGTKNTGASACNASGAVKHGYPAIDFLSLRSGGATGSLQTDPVYPMGAGIAHVGNKNFSCQSSGTKGSNGNEGNGAWVWIDHGGGVVSRYHHLSEIDVTDGEYVNLDTKLGRTGHSGDVCKSAADTVNYLHIEVRTGGVNGTRVPIGIGPYDRGIGSLLACSGGQATWPKDIGGPYNVADWNQVTWHEDSPFIPAAGGGCLPATPATATRPSGFTATTGDQQVTLSWNAADPGAAVNSITLGSKIYRPSQNGYSQESWRMGVPGNSTSITLTKSFDGSTLVNGRSYKFRLTFHNAVGNSAWSKWLTVVPGAVPNRSAGVRTATIARFYIGFGWYWTSKDANGLPMKRFDLAIRKHGTPTWKTFKGSVSSHYYKFGNLKPKTSYDVRVRGVNTAGPGPWLTRTYKTKA